MQPQPCEVRSEREAVPSKANKAHRSFEKLHSHPQTPSMYTLPSFSLFTFHGPTVPKAHATPTYSINKQILVQRSLKRT